MNNFVSLMNVLFAILGISGIIGTFLIIRNTRRAAIVTIQDQTIQALQQQINALKAGQEALQKDNSHLQYVIETISSALKQKGILITIEGEMVTLEDGRRSSSIRRSTKQTTQAEKIVKHNDIS
jgi:hypothetical protein